jgi:hypothetical protein
MENRIMKPLSATRTSLAAIALLVALAAPAFGQFTISGTVTGGGSPVSGAEIRLFTSTGTPIGIPPTFTTAAGAYSIAGLPNGSYTLQFRPPTATRLVAAELPATVAGANAVRNAPLAAGFLLSGYVRDGNGVGLASIDLQVYDRDTNELMLTPGDDTDATGFYDVVVPAGEYDLEWRAVGAGALPYIPFADRAVVDEDVQIDVTLLLGVFVSGRVTTTSGTGLPGVNLDFIDTTTGVKALTPGDNTAADGTFTAHVPPGTYDVVAKALPATRLLPGIASGVAVNADVVGLDFSLGAGVLLSGTVSGPGGLLEGVDLDVTDAVTGADMLAPFDVTDAAGSYRIVLPNGTYHVAFAPPAGEVIAPAMSAGVIVAGDTVLNRTLAPGIVFSGTITSGGAPVANTDIDLKDPATGLNLPLSGEATNAAGVFSTIAAAGTWILEIEPPVTTGLVAQRTEGFVLSANTNLPVSLQAGVIVTGTVTDGAGALLADVNVDALRSSDGFEMFTPGDHTNAAGIYQLVVPAGAYDFRFKLGASHAVPDSTFVTGVTVAPGAVVDAVIGQNLSSVGDQVPAGRSTALTLSPNPFNPSTVIAFDQARPGAARLTIHSAAGRRVRELVAGDRPAGRHEIRWDGRDNAGRRLASGVYLVIFDAPGQVAGAKAILVK